mgnify:CR=1 FL=1|tara:strand:- start:404 stop:592 length:189 start_codon:yes stop_codon:yes gene_type:complete
MNLDLDLVIGDKVSWTSGRFFIIGVVLEDHKKGIVEIMTHTRDGNQHNQTVFANKSDLTLIY